MILNPNILKKTKRHFFAKKLLALTLSLLFLLPLVLSAGLTGRCYTARLTGKNEVGVGDSFTLRFALDSGAYGFQGVLEYDTSILKLSNQKAVNGKYQKEFHVYADSGLIVLTHDRPVTQFLNLTFYVLDDAEVGDSATIRFTSGEILNNSFTEKLEDVSFTVTVVDTKSSEASLSSLNVTAYSEEQDANGFMLTLNPNFDGATTLYSATVPNEYYKYQIFAIPKDANASIKTSLAGELQEGINTILLVVTAEDGSEKEYTLMLFRERPPEISEVVPDVSFGESDESSGEISEEISEELSWESSDAASEDESLFVEESDTSEELSIEQSEESVVASSAPTFSQPELIKPYQPKERNWSGVIIGLGVIGGVAVVALLVRLFLLYRKRQGI